MRLSKGSFAHGDPSRVQGLSATAASEVMAELAAGEVRCLESLGSVSVQAGWVAPA